MKKLTMFYLENCPYCIKARAFIDELRAENRDYEAVEIDMVEEEEHPEIIANYDYYRVSCFYIGNEKVFEAHSMIPDAELKAGVKKALDEALL